MNVKTYHQKVYVPYVSHTSVYNKMNLRLGNKTIRMLNKT